MAKRRKPLTRKKGFQGRWALKKLNTGPTPGWTSDLGYKDRVRSLTVSRLFKLTDLGEGGDERKAALEYLEKLTKKYVLVNHVCLANSTLRRLFMFWAGHDCFQFVCSEFNNRRIRRSIIYGSRNIAMYAFYLDPKELTKIKWVEEMW